MRNNEISDCKVFYLIFLDLEYFVVQGISFLEDKQLWCHHVNFLFSWKMSENF